ncbi:MAG: serine hydrolase, partial [Deltaproteobacteria bacterium]|nr:serine hydrolase [Deltaproteobacteria bacterium]
LEHAMNMTTGLDWVEDWSGGGRNDVLNGLRGGSLVDYVVSRPAAAEPGGDQRYSTGDPALVTQVLRDATGEDPLDYARKRLFEPLGIPDVEWAKDAAGRTTTYAGVRATVREYAAIGELVLERGKRDGATLVPEAWIDRSSVPSDRCSSWYQLLWHVNAPVRFGDEDPACADTVCAPIAYANLPHEAFYAMGVQGQFIAVVPSAELLVVRVAADRGASPAWDAMARGIVERLLTALGT